MALRVLPKRAGSDPSLRQLDRMAHQPGLDAPRVRLDVELEAEQLGPLLEGLDRAVARECKRFAGRRQIEIVTVPMQDVAAINMTQGACLLYTSPSPRD